MKSRPKLTPISEEMKQWSALLGEEPSSWAAVSSRRMFGMMGFYRNNKIFAVLPRTRTLETPNWSGVQTLHAHAQIMEAAPG